jgi:hypothetical protein
MSDTFGKRDSGLPARTGTDSSGPQPDPATNPMADMAEATRLTGLGRLEEATALIQRSLSGRGGGGAAARPAGGETGPGLRVREMVDSVVRGIAPVLKGLGQPLRGPQPAPQRAASGSSGGSFLDRSHAGPAGSRDYKLFVPSQPQEPAATAAPRTRTISPPARA